ncbi:MAG: hypothetical protein IH857_01790 [Deltaproteobacteria bacterium]|nr:hypothetical protein [Deltaproteobacteria bacterium]
MRPLRNWLVLTVAVGYLYHLPVPETQAQVLANLVNVDLKVEVTFNPATGVYSYSYTIISGPENVGDIHMLMITILTGKIVDPVIDPDLVSDESFTDGNLAPTRTVPVGLQSPSRWQAGVSIDGRVGWDSSFMGIDVAPGKSLGGFVINSKAPPGRREFEIHPVLPFSDPNVFPEDCEIDPNCPDPESFNVTGQTTGPVLAEELTLIDAKGQRPSDVNTFLKFSNPLVTSTTLPAGVKIFDLVIIYGPTINPATFGAVLNGTDITPSFTVSPGGASVVRLDLVDGRNTLVLSVEGVRSDGRTGLDTNRLTFIIPSP